MSVELLLPIFVNQLEGGRTLNTYGLMHDDCEQYENGELFGTGRGTLMRVHREFRARVKDYSAKVLEMRIDGDISYLHVLYRFIDERGRQHELPGVHAMRWQGNMIAREDFWVEEFYEEKRAEFLGD